VRRNKSSLRRFAAEWNEFVFCWFTSVETNIFYILWNVCNYNYSLGDTRKQRLASCVRGESGGECGLECGLEALYAADLCPDSKRGEDQLPALMVPAERGEVLFITERYLPGNMGVKNVRTLAKINPPSTSKINPPST
jgi:hypothetical protein